MKTILFLILLINLLSCGNPMKYSETTVSSTVDEINNNSDADSDDNSEDGAGINGNTIYYTGIDYQGNTKTCQEISKGTNCSYVLTPSDSYANDCQKAGKKAIQCACHDWICI